MSDREKDREAVEWLAAELERAVDGGWGMIDVTTMIEARKVWSALALARAHLAMLDAGPVGYRVTHNKTYPSLHLVWDDAYDAAVDWNEDKAGESRIVPLYALPEEPTP